jgi:hypothetical protein
MGDDARMAKSARNGRILEDVVALLHDDPNVIVQKRVKLPSLANPKRTREIDVLATAPMLGRAMHMAFECKNYGSRIGVEKIDEFAGKLEDVGIPPQYGIFVTASDFTLDARQRAKSRGIRLLRLEGLTKERLAAEVHDAFHSIVYLRAVVASVTITNEVAEASPTDLLMLRNADGEIVGGVPDLLWAQWRDGKIPTALGDHQVQIDLPRGWRWVCAGVETATRAEAIVRVQGVIATLQGNADRLVLRDAETDQIDRARLSVDFIPPETRRITMPVEIVNTEAELAEKTMPAGVAQITVGRIPLPRILYNGNIYWPPSLRASLELKQRALQLERAGQWRPGCLEHLTLGDIEGTDLGAMFEEISPEHPAAHDPRWPWPQKRPRGRTIGPIARPARRTGSRSKRSTMH